MSVLYFTLLISLLFTLYSRLGQIIFQSASLSKDLESMQAKTALSLVFQNFKFENLHKTFVLVTLPFFGQFPFLVTYLFFSYKQFLHTSEGKKDERIN